MKLSLLKNLLVAGAVVALASCGKDEPVDPMANFNITKPASVIEVLEVSTIRFDEEEFKFTYDANGKLDKVTSSYSDSDDWGTWSSESEYSFVYTDDKISSVIEKSKSTQTPEGGEPVNSSRTNTITFSYNSNDLISAVKREYVRSYDGQESADSWNSTFEYNADNQMVKEVSSDEGGNWQEWQTSEWNGQNVAKQAYYYENTSGGRKMPRVEQKRPSSIMSRFGNKTPELEEEIIFSEYDSKVNPLTVFTVLDGYFGGLFISRNNVGKGVFYDVDDAGNLVEGGSVAVELEYDSKGRPTKYIMTETFEDDVDVEEVTVTYRN